MTDQPHTAPLPADSGRGPEEEIAELVIRLASDLEAWIGRAVAPLELTEPQAVLIRLLRQPISMGAAAEALYCDASNLTGIVDRLEKRGLVERRTLPADRRVKQLVLTSSGRRLCERLEEMATAAPGLSDLSNNEQETLIMLLRRALESQVRSGAHSGR
jgi:DNA-binding MarR family transcriptional regulator